MSDPLPLSVFVVTLNEEVNLERCLASCHDLAEEIIIIDSGSADGTRAVADRYGARWVEQEWLGHRDQKKVGVTHCSQRWTLMLDADEELSPELREEIIAFVKEDGNGMEGAGFPRRTWFLGRWILHGDWYPDRKLRLYLTEKVSITGAPEHDVAEVPGDVQRMKGDMNHYSFPNMLAYVGKIPPFSDAFLVREIEAGKNWSLATTLFRPWWRFFRAYVLRAGFLDGFPGFWIAISTAYLSFVRYSRLYEHEKNKDSS